MWSRKNLLQPTDTVVGCWAHSTLLAWISTGVLSRLHGRWLMSPPVLFALRLAVPISNHWWEFCHSSRRPSSSAGQFDPWPLARYCPASARDGRRRAESIFDAVSAIAIVRGCLSVWLASRPAWQLRVRRPGHITRLRRPAGAWRRAVNVSRRPEFREEKASRFKDISVNGRRSRTSWEMFDRIDVNHPNERKTLPGPYQQRAGRHSECQAEFLLWCSSYWQHGNKSCSGQCVWNQTVEKFWV